nr:transglutaminase domain-containing protein [uncultured Psychroserpens sp.]
MRYCLLSLAFIIVNTAFSQDYKSIDSIVEQYPEKFRSIDYFANRIDKDFDTDIDKVRAVYYWISNHIEYDYKSYRNGSNGYKSIAYNDDGDYENRLKSLRKNYAEKSLKKRLAVCEGYSQLLKFTLLELGIEAEVIKGYAKKSVREIGLIKKGTNHAWNAVKIDNQWQLIDATWSTGNTEKNPKDFDFSDEYFLIAPEQLILNHFPKETKWQLLKRPIKKSTFFYFPKIYTPFITSGLVFKKGQVGILKAKTGSHITLKFNAAKTDVFYSYAFKDDEYSTKFLFEKENDEYVAEIPFNYKRNSTLTIFYNGLSVLDYKIIFQK